MDTPNDSDMQGLSLVQTLKNALESNDDRLVRTVLNHKEENVIHSTLKGLPPRFVAVLLDHITVMAHEETRNVEVAALILWMKHLLQIHSAQLMAFGRDELNVRFGSLHGMLEGRTSASTQLSGLSGRLDFLLSKINYQSSSINHGNGNLLVIESDEDNFDDDGDDNDDANSTDEDAISYLNG